MKINTIPSRIKANIIILVICTYIFLFRMELVNEAESLPQLLESLQIERDKILFSYFCFVVQNFQYHLSVYTKIIVPFIKKKENPDERKTQR